MIFSEGNGSIEPHQTLGSFSSFEKEAIALFFMNFTNLFTARPIFSGTISKKGKL